MIYKMIQKSEDAAKRKEQNARYIDSLRDITAELEAEHEKERGQEPEAVLGGEEERKSTMMMNLMTWNMRWIHLTREGMHCLPCLTLLLLLKSEFGVLFSFVTTQRHSFHFHFSFYSFRTKSVIK